MPLSHLVVEFQVRRASSSDLHEVAELFDSYRQFYKQSADSSLAEGFIRDRLTKSDSVIFLATDSQTGTSYGFIQLYPAFSSVAARPIWILNDLFVAAAARRKGVGRALLEAAREFAIATSAKRLVLSTAADNIEARALYESCGYKQELVFVSYTLDL